MSDEAFLSTSRWEWALLTSTTIIENLCKHTNNRLFLTVAVGIILMIMRGENRSSPADAHEKSDRFFTINLIVPIGNTPREKAGQILARDLEKIGIGVNLHYMEFASITPRWKASVANQCRLR
jgi:hypothetical protein